VHALKVKRILREREGEKKNIKPSMIYTEDGDEKDILQGMKLPCI